MIRQFVHPNDPVLQKVAEIVPPDELNSSRNREYIEEMIGTAYGRRKNRDKPTVVGLAAPQIGISRRIIAVDTGADGVGGLSELKVYINPEITWSSKETEEWCEGCWSTGRVAGVVSRPKKIKIKAYSPQGDLIEEEHEGYVARIFQHEVDHLNGIEFVNHIKNPKKLHWVEIEQWSEYKNHGGWRTWQNLCPREKWEEIKGISQNE
ncbi:MAG TPA: peptide deformylase [Patescibacteria group bacterium]|nr:peptide deformylase [Patescibacteria group bacterium]